MSSNLTTSDKQPQLSRSIGLGRVLFQSVGFMGPGASIVFGLGLIIANTGAASPFTMLLTLIAAIFVAVGVGQLATRIPGAGGIYSLASVAIGPDVGFLVGWTYAIMALIMPAVGALLFGIVGKDFCTTYFHFTPPWWVLALAVLAVALGFSYFGVEISTRVTLVLGTIEVVILGVVSLLLIIHAGGANTLAVFNPANAAQAGKSTTGWIFLGVVYAMAMFVDFTSAIHLAEEAKNPRWVVPRALLIATIMIGLFYVVAMYAAVVAWGPSDLGGYLTSPNPWQQLSGKLGSWATVLVLLAILSSVMAMTQAGYTATTRLLFAMSRSGVLPRPLSKVHIRHKTPYIAALVTGALTTVAMFLAAWKFGDPFNAFVYMITIMAVVFLFLYIIACVGCIVYFLTKGRAELNILLHVVAPLIAVVMLVPALYYSGSGLAYPASWSVPTILVWFGIGIIILVVLRVQHRDVSTEMRRWTVAAADEVEESLQA
jgi:amino acid transporter